MLVVQVLVQLCRGRIGVEQLRQGPVRAQFVELFDQVPHDRTVLLGTDRHRAALQSLQQLRQQVRDREPRVRGIGFDRIHGLHLGAQGATASAAQAAACSQPLEQPAHAGPTGAQPVQRRAVGCAAAVRRIGRHLVPGLVQRACQEIVVGAVVHHPDAARQRHALHQVAQLGRRSRRCPGRSGAGPSARCRPGRPGAPARAPRCRRGRTGCSRGTGRRGPRRGRSHRCAGPGWARRR